MCNNIVTQNFFYFWIFFFVAFIRIELVVFGNWNCSRMYLHMPLCVLETLSICHRKCMCTQEKYTMTKMTKIWKKCPQPNYKMHCIQYAAMNGKVEVLNEVFFNRKHFQQLASPRRWKMLHKIHEISTSSTYAWNIITSHVGNGNVDRITPAEQQITHCLPFMQMQIIALKMKS